METKFFSIELDCAPGAIRPGDLLSTVTKDTGLVLDKPDSMSFGNWEWVIPADQHELYEKVQPLVKNRIEALYHKGFIRYGSW
jgi:hypothetical protein